MFSSSLCKGRIQTETVGLYDSVSSLLEFRKTVNKVVDGICSPEL